MIVGRMLESLGEAVAFVDSVEITPPADESGESGHEPRAVPSPPANLPPVVIELPRILDRLAEEAGIPLRRVTAVTGMSPEKMRALVAEIRQQVGVRHQEVARVWQVRLRTVAAERRREQADAERVAHELRLQRESQPISGAVTAPWGASTLT